MAQIGSLATQKVVGILRAEAGLPGSIAQLTSSGNTALPAFVADQVIGQNVSPEIAERTTAAKYPLVYVYCNRLSNVLTEKFRQFSGQAQMVAEVRVSQDRLEGLESVSQLYSDAVSQVLDRSRGDWGDGIFYCGGYEINYGPVKSGGKNLIQAAKIAFTLEVSV